jgi:hypothetical protein
VQPRLLRLREWLRGQGFKCVQSLRAEIGGGVHLRLAAYQDEAAQIRIHVTFLPQAGGAIGVCHSLATCTARPAQSSAMPGSLPWCWNGVPRQSRARVTIWSGVMIRSANRC